MIGPVLGCRCMADMMPNQHKTPSNKSLNIFNVFKLMRRESRIYINTYYFYKFITINNLI